MGKSLYTCLFLAVILPIFLCNKSYDGYQLLSFKLENEDQVSLINDWVTENNDNANVFIGANVGAVTEIAVSPSLLNEFLGMLEGWGIVPEVQIENLGQEIDRTNFDNEIAKEIKKTFRSSPVNQIVGVYARHSEIRHWLNIVVQTYPQYTQIINIGNSYEGRAMEVLRIKTGTATKPIIFIDSAIHAREWLAPASLIYVINKLLMGIQSGDAAVKAILDKYEIQALPVVNPDGYEYTFVVDRLWRKTRRPVASGCIGADPNRNFDAAFGTTGVSTNCRSDVYPGNQPFSEIEAKNLANYINRIQSNTKLYLSLHTFGEFWLTPYGYTSRARPPNAAESDRVANLGAEAIARVSGHRFKVAPPYVHLYEASGGAYDWVLLKTSVPYGYTLELRPAFNSVNGAAGFIAATSEIRPSGEELFAAVSSMAANMR